MFLMSYHSHPKSPYNHTPTTVELLQEGSARSLGNRLVFKDLMQTELFYKQHCLFLITLLSYDNPPKPVKSSPLLEVRGRKLKLTRIFLHTALHWYSHNQKYIYIYFKLRKLHSSWTIFKIFSDLNDYILEDEMLLWYFILVLTVLFSK